MNCFVCLVDLIVNGNYFGMMMYIRTFVSFVNFLYFSFRDFIIVCFFVFNVLFLMLYYVMLFIFIILNVLFVYFIILFFVNFIFFTRISYSFSSFRIRIFVFNFGCNDNFKNVNLFSFILNVLLFMCLIDFLFSVLYCDVGSDMYV